LSSQSTSDHLCDKYTKLNIYWHIGSSVPAEQREKESKQLHIIVNMSVSTDGAAWKQLDAYDYNECASLYLLLKYFIWVKQIRQAYLLKYILVLHKRKPWYRKESKVRSTEYPEHVHRLFITLCSHFYNINILQFVHACKFLVKSLIFVLAQEAIKPMSTCNHSRKTLYEIKAYKSWCLERSRIKL